MRRARTFVLLALTLLLVTPAVSAEVLDPTYGEGGHTRATFDDFFPVGSYIGVIDNAGRALQLGVAETDRLVRFDDDGQLDTAFGDGGGVELPDGIAVWVRGVEGHGVVVGGVARAANGSGGVDTYVLRLTESGEPDTRFGDDGFLWGSDDDDIDVEPFALGLDGRLLVERRVFLQESGYVRTWELYDASGDLDGGFGTAGSIDAPTAQRDDLGADVAIDAADGVVYIDQAGVLRRLLPDGRSDASFGDDGAVGLPGPGTSSDFALDVAADGIAVGRQIDDGTTTVWRFTSAGAPEPRFASIPVTWQLHAGQLQISALAMGRTAVTSGNTVDDVLVLAPNGMPDPGWAMGPRTFSGERLLGVGDGGVAGRLLLGRVTDGGLSFVSRYLLDEGGLPLPVITTVVGRPDGVTLFWEVPPALAAEAVAFHIILVNGSRIGGHLLVAGDVREASINGLDEGGYFEAYVVPYLRSGAGPRSEPLVVSTSDGGPEAGSPSSVGLITTNPVDRGIQVSWQPANGNGAPILAYSAIAVDPATGEIAAWRNVGPDVRSAALVGLAADRTNYIVYVIAWNEHGIGGPNFTGGWTAPGQIGQGPTVSWVSGVRAPGATYVTWSAPIEHGQPIVGFDVVVIEDGVMISWAQPGPDQRQLVLPELQDGSDAQVYVFAHSASGFGPVGAPAEP